MSDGPTSRDAADRAIVRLADGRTARLLYVPDRSARGSQGRHVRVVLPSGAVLSVDAGSVRVVRPMPAGSGRRAAHELVLMPRIRG